MSQVSIEEEFTPSNISPANQSGSSTELSQASFLTQESSEPCNLSPPIRGWVNEHFTTTFVDNRNMRKCLAEGCSKQYAAGSSTRVFKDHWLKEHSMISSLRKTRFMFHDELHTNRLIKVIISRHLQDYHLLDYTLVDDIEFKKFVSSLNPNKHIICRQTLSDVINRSKIHLTNKVCEKLEIAESVALTFDIWSVRKGARGFGCVTAHYINSSGAIENLILYFKRMKFPHDANTIRKFIEKPIRVHKLEGRIAAITTVNASNNLAAIRQIDQSMGLTSLNLGFIHYKCVAHIFDLGMKDAMKSLKDTVKPVRDAVVYIRSSRKRKEKFIDKQQELIDKHLQHTKQPLELAEDVDHRWNSAFVLLERAHLLRDSVDHMIATTDLDLIISIDWDTIEEVINFLKPFNVATKRLCSASEVTISMVSDIAPKLIDHCNTHEGSTNEWVAEAAESMKSKLTDYQLDLYQPIVETAYFLDPRYKTKNMSEEYRERVIDRMRYLMELTPLTATEAATSASSSILDCDVDDSTDELTAYCESRRVNMETEVAMWWKGNAKTYPKLSSIARKILPIQATSVASERVFSVAGDVDTKCRNRLSDESVENIVLFKSWMQFLNIE